jgi:carbon-monoxide dehydrogenase medium subunit
VIPTAFEYHRASSIEDALAKLAEGGKLLAGGHSLIPLMKLRLSEPGVLIDISRLPELAGIREHDGKFEIGAATVHQDIATSERIRQRCPALADCAADIGDPQVRNRGTIGGSLAHADPSADYPAVVLALDAVLEIRGPNGSRTVAATDFFQGMFTVDLAPDEIIVTIRVTPVRAAAYVKLHQKASGFAIIGIAAALEVSEGTIASARIGLTGARSSATRLTAVEQALAGKPANVESIAAAAANAGADLDDLNSDIHASADYRRAMVAVFTRRALEGALARA